VSSATQPPRYRIGVASKDHVARGVAGGFCQLGHGKAAPLKRMATGDWIIYYSSKVSLERDEPCQQFTALGRITGAAPYLFEMSPTFAPYRRDVKLERSKDVAIRPMLADLDFIRDKTRWGYSFRFGHFEIQRADFERIAKTMLGHTPA
jgi:EVE domain